MQSFKGVCVTIRLAIRSAQLTLGNRDDFLGKYCSDLNKRWEFAVVSLDQFKFLYGLFFPPVCLTEMNFNVNLS